MRYISYIKSLALKTLDGTTKYQFRNGVLDLGSGNTINPDAAGPNNSKLHNYASYFGSGASTAAKQAGETYLYWESPLIAVGGTLTVGTWYKVLNKPATYNGVQYPVGSRFLCVTGVTVHSGTGSSVCVDVPAEYYIPDEVNTRKESFKKLNLIKGSEAVFNEDIYGAAAVTPGTTL